MWTFLVILSFIAVAESCKAVVDKPDGIVPRREDHPSHVLIETFQSYEEKFWCSGVLISAKYVLTTAECVINQMFVNVHIYPNKLRDVFEVEREIYRSTDVQFKPDFDGATYLNDVALIKLPVTLDIAAKPYAIAKLPGYSNYLDEGREGTTVGYGLLNYKNDKASTYKNEQTMKVVSSTKCREAYPKWSSDSNYLGRMCIQRETGNNCVSDVGSPFYIDDVVYGLQSFGQMQACESTLPNGIQEVRWHRVWIDPILNMKD
jgi:secreted trypsin-like serine protease